MQLGLCFRMMRCAKEFGLPLLMGVSGARTYSYDELNRIASVVDNRLPAGENTTIYTYDPANNLATATYPNGQQFTFSYDSLNRLTGLNGYSYQLGPTGNRQSATEPSGRTANWIYDGIYRLTNETITLDPHAKNGSVAYGLDPVGNRLSQTSSLSGIPSGTFGYDANDRLPTETYDANGNTIVSGARTFTYDFENRLKSMNGGAVTLQYDGDGNRVAKSIGGVTTQYLVDDLNPTGYAQVVEELVNGIVQRTYTYGLQRINQRQFLSNTWQATFYGYDGFGSVRLLTDASGTVTDTYDYDAWGNLLNSTGGTLNVYLYRGEQYDPDLALYYLRARYFNPLTGLFLTRDPDEGAITEPWTLQKYMFAGDDPVNRVDPTGWEAQTWSAGGGALTPEAGGYVHLYNGFAKWTCDISLLRPGDLWNGGCGCRVGSLGGPSISFKPGVPEPSRMVDTLVRCIAGRACTSLVVTSTSDSHEPTDPHTRGLGVDVRYPSNPGAVLSAAKCCGAGFGLDEKKHPSRPKVPPHIHIQIPFGRGGARGDLPKNWARKL